MIEQRPADIQDFDPKPGYYMRRLVKGGPWVPARIWLEDGEREMCEACSLTGYTVSLDDRPKPCDECGGVGTILVSDQIWKCVVDGIERDPFKEWLFLAKHPIKQRQYERMVAQSTWDKNNDPDAPASNPRQPIELDKVKPSNYGP